MFIKFVILSITKCFTLNLPSPNKTPFIDSDLLQYIQIYYILLNSNMRQVHPFCLTCIYVRFSECLMLDSILTMMSNKCTHIEKHYQFLLTLYYITCCLCYQNKFLQVILNVIFSVALDMKCTSINFRYFVIYCRLQ